EWRERAMKALSSVGMERFADHYPAQLSVGMRQRVNVARGMSAGTDILLMDEPVAALDEQSRLVLRGDLSGLLAQTTETIVVVTHGLAEAVSRWAGIVWTTAGRGQIKAIMAVGEPHPRVPDFMLTQRFSELRNLCYASLRDEIRESMTREGGQGEA